MAVDVLLRLFAPFIPFATEEVWSWTHEGSVHTAEWPTLLGASQPTGLLGLVGEALVSIRGAKTEAKASQKTEVVSATISGPPSLAAASEDLKAVGRIAELTFVVADEVRVTDIVLVEQGIVLADQTGA
jgi:valyl-tRNA synthetase